MTDSATKDQVSQYISKLMVQFLVEYEDSNGKRPFRRFLTHFGTILESLTKLELTLSDLNFFRYQFTRIFLAKNPRFIQFPRR